MPSLDVFCESMDFLISNIPNFKRNCIKFVHRTFQPIDYKYKPFVTSYNINTTEKILKIPTPIKMSIPAFILTATK